MGIVDAEQTLARAGGEDKRRAPDDTCCDVIHHACTLATLLVNAAADLRSNGQRVRDGLVTTRQCVRQARELSAPQISDLHQQAIAARLVRMRGQLETLRAPAGSHMPIHQDDRQARTRAIAVSTLEQDVLALEQEMRHRQRAAAEQAVAHEGTAREIGEALLMMDGLIETLYALVQSAVLHENAAAELKELLEASRLMAALDPHH